MTMPPAGAVTQTGGGFSRLEQRTIHQNASVSGGAGQVKLMCSRLRRTRLDRQQTAPSAAGRAFVEMTGHRRATPCPSLATRGPRGEPNLAKADPPLASCCRAHCPNKVFCAPPPPCAHVGLGEYGRERAKTSAPGMLGGGDGVPSVITTRIPRLLGGSHIDVSTPHTGPAR